MTLWAVYWEKAAWNKLETSLETRRGNADLDLFLYIWKQWLFKMYKTKCGQLSTSIMQDDPGFVEEDEDT